MVDCGLLIEFGGCWSRERLIVEFLGDAKYHAIVADLCPPLVRVTIWSDFCSTRKKYASPTNFDICLHMRLYALSESICAYKTDLMLTDTLSFSDDNVDGCITCKTVAVIESNFSSSSLFATS